VLLLFAAAYVPAYWLGNQIIEGRNALQRVGNLENEGSFTERLEMAKSSIAIFRDHAPLGAGLGAYKLLYPAYHSPNERTTTGDLGHNDYAQALGEGGIPLLLALLALAFNSLRLALRRLWLPLNRARLSPGGWQRAGMAAALLAFFAHALMNFIIYAAALALVAGVYMACVDDAPKLRGKQASTTNTGPWRKLLIAALALWLLPTLGSRAAYVALNDNNCALKACMLVHRTGEEKIFKLATLIAATQPSWLPARNDLVDHWLRLAESAKTPAARTQAAGYAAIELDGMIRQGPDIDFSYSRLAKVLLAYPELEKIFKGHPQRTPDALFALAQQRNRLDMEARNVVALGLERHQQTEQAYALMCVEGMQYWDGALLADDQRRILLTFCLPREIQRGHCEEARDMAIGLRGFDPGNALAQQAAAIPTKASGDHCGLATAQ
jgi:hypothetical protein